jgi:hypothetical protein
LEAAVTSGHPRAVPAARAGLDQLRTGRPTGGSGPRDYEILR